MSTSSNPLLDALKNRILKEIVKENEEKKDEKLGSENTVDERGEKRKMKENKEEDADDEAEGEDEEKPRKKKKRSLGSHRDTKDQQYVSTFTFSWITYFFKSLFFSSTCSTVSNIEAMDCSDSDGEIEGVEADNSYLYAWIEKLTLEGSI